MGKPKEERKPWEGYSVESLHNGIQSCKVNIKTFEDAIGKERETIANYKWMIERIEEKKATAIAADAMGQVIEADIARQNAEFTAKAIAAGRKVVHVKPKEKGNGDSQ